MAKIQWGRGSNFAQWQLERGSLYNSFKLDEGTQPPAATRNSRKQKKVSDNWVLRRLTKDHWGREGECERVCKRGREGARERNQMNHWLLLASRKSESGDAARAALENWFLCPGLSVRPKVMGVFTSVWRIIGIYPNPAINLWQVHNILDRSAISKHRFTIKRPRN